MSEGAIVALRAMSLRPQKLAHRERTEGVPYAYGSNAALSLPRVRGELWS